MNFLRSLINHPTGEMSIRYVRTCLQSFNIKCRKHGKVNEYVRALATAGWIEQVGGHIVRFRGRHWQVGEPIRGKMANHSTTDPALFTIGLTVVVCDGANEFRDANVW